MLYELKLGHNIAEALDSKAMVRAIVYQVSSATHSTVWFVTLTISYKASGTTLLSLLGAAEYTDCFSAEG